MKTIEIRRHSMRSIPSAHLSQEGVTLARRIGQELGPFARVITSTLPRAFETAIAMGFAVDEQVELMSTYSEDVYHEVPWPQSFAAYDQAVRRDRAAAKYARSLADYYSGLANALDEDAAALVINHGGIVELGVVASFADADYESWDGPADYCEGAQLFWKDGKFVGAELLRISS